MSQFVKKSVKQSFVRVSNGSKPSAPYELACVKGVRNTSFVPAEDKDEKKKLKKDKKKKKKKKHLGRLGMLNKIIENEQTNRHSRHLVHPQRSANYDTDRKRGHDQQQ